MSDGIAVGCLMDFIIEFQVYGTPKQCLEKTLAIREGTGNDTLVASSSCGGMPCRVSEGNVGLSTAEVMPELQNLEL